MEGELSECRHLLREIGFDIPHVAADLGLVQSLVTFRFGGMQLRGGLERRSPL